MMSVLGRQRLAEEFATALDAAPAGALRGELAELVAVVEGLRAVDSTWPAPRPEFTSALRDRLMAAAPRALAPSGSTEGSPAPGTRSPSRRGTGARERRLAALASSFALVGGSAGMAMAAQQALPGDALYPVKRGIEAAKVELSAGPGNKGSELLDQADRRLSEARALLEDPGDPAHVTQLPGTIDAYRDQAQDGATLLLDSFADERDPDAVQEVRRFTAHGMRVLEQLVVAAPDAHQAVLSQAAVTLASIDTNAGQACAPCDGREEDLEIPDVLLPSSGDPGQGGGTAAGTGGGPVVATTDGSGTTGTPDGGVDGGGVSTDPGEVPDGTGTDGGGASTDADGSTGTASGGSTGADPGTDTGTGTGSQTDGAGTTDPDTGTGTGTDPDGTGSTPDTEPPAPTPSDSTDPPDDGVDDGAPAEGEQVDPGPQVDAGGATDSPSADGATGGVVEDVVPPTAGTLA